MIEAVIGWSLRNRALVLVATGFLVAAGVWAMRETPLDAIPDLSDVQVIVQTDFAEQAPQIVEDQVTYPLTKHVARALHEKLVVPADLHLDAAQRHADGGGLVVMQRVRADHRTGLGQALALDDRHAEPDEHLGDVG